MKVLPDPKRRAERKATCATGEKVTYKPTTVVNCNNIVAALSTPERQKPAKTVFKKSISDDLEKITKDVPRAVWDAVTPYDVRNNQGTDYSRGRQRRYLCAACCNWQFSDMSDHNKNCKGDTLLPTVTATTLVYVVADAASSPVYERVVGDSSQASEIQEVAAPLTADMALDKWVELRAEGPRLILPSVQRLNIGRVLRGWAAPPVQKCWTVLSITLVGEDETLPQSTVQYAHLIPPGRQIVLPATPSVADDSNRPKVEAALPAGLKRALDAQTALPAGRAVEAQTNCEDAADRQQEDLANKRARTTVALPDGLGLALLKEKGKGEGIYSSGKLQTGQTLGNYTDGAVILDRKAYQKLSNVDTTYIMTIGHQICDHRNGTNWLRLINAPSATEKTNVVVDHTGEFTFTGPPEYEGFLLLDYGDGYWKTEDFNKTGSLEVAVPDNLHAIIDTTLEADGGWEDIFKSEGVMDPYRRMRHLRGGDKQDKLFRWVGKTFDETLGDALSPWFAVQNVALDSIAGGPDQELHKDISKSMFQNNDEWPIHSGMITGSAGAQLVIQRPGRDEPETVTIGKYTLLMFHGRLLHGGKGMEFKDCCEGKDGKMHHRRIHCYVGSEILLGKIKGETMRGVTKENGFLNGTDLTDRMTSLRWYDP